MSGMSNLAEVEIHEAYFWICDSCGRENYDRAREATEEERGFWAESLAEANMDPNDFMSPFTIPGVVTCQHCGDKFLAIIPGENDDAEEEE